MPRISFRALSQWNSTPQKPPVVESKRQQEVFLHTFLPKTVMFPCLQFRASRAFDTVFKRDENVVIKKDGKNKKTIDKSDSIRYNSVITCATSDELQ